MRSGGSTNKPQPPLPGSNEKDSEAQGLDEEGRFTHKKASNRPCDSQGTHLKDFSFNI